MNKLQYWWICRHVWAWKGWKRWIMLAFCKCGIHLRSGTHTVTKHFNDREGRRQKQSWATHDTCHVCKTVTKWRNKDKYEEYKLHAR